MVEKSGVEKSRVEMSSFYKVKGHFNELFKPMVQKFIVEKSGVEKFMVGKYGVEKSRIEAWG